MSISIGVGASVSLSSGTVKPAVALFRIGISMCFHWAELDQVCDGMP